MKKAFIILGLGFGDEGKGLVTDYLCNAHSSKSLLIRFNGGQQAGHTVVTNVDQHVFSNFGSGTFRGVPTYWSPFCTFSPAYFLNEFKIIKSKPLLFLDILCPVTTHYDVLYNRLLELSRGNSRHGSCGLGFGSTIDREKKQVRFHVNDLQSRVVYTNKLKTIKAFYKKKIKEDTKFDFENFNHSIEDEKFDYYIGELMNLIDQGFVQLVNKDFIKETKNRFDNYIFEGAQGILLDINYGNWPYITKSNTTSQNALKILNANFSTSEISKEIYYVTRSYQTRHGAGPFEQKTHPILLLNTYSETNTYNPYQKEFRVRCLDINDLNYALSCDANFSKGLSKHLIVTCVDQIEKNNLPIFFNGKVKFISYDNLTHFINCTFQSCQYSFSEHSNALNTQ